MSLIVKTCGLQTEKDVEAAVDAGADALGFVFYPLSLRYVQPHEAVRAVTGAPRSLLRVAVMLHPSNDEWQSVLQEFVPDVLQTDLEDFEALLVPPSVQRWPVIRAGGSAENDGLPDIFLYEGEKSGQGLAVDWQRAAKLARRSKLILAGGLDADNVGKAVVTVRPAGVDASSGLESAPGKKSPALIKQFVAAARAAEISL